MPKCKMPLENSEKELGTWTTNFLIPNVGRYVGDLTITDKRVIFLSKFDTSLNSVINMAFFETYEDEEYMILPRENYEDEEYMILPRENINKVIPKKSLLNKRVTLLTNNNEEYIIDYGMLSINAIVEALEKS